MINIKGIKTINEIFIKKEERKKYKITNNCWKTYLNKIKYISPFYFIYSFISPKNISNFKTNKESNQSYSLNMNTSNFASSLNPNLALAEDDKQYHFISECKFKVNY